MKLMTSKNFLLIMLLASLFMAMLLIHGVVKDSAIQQQTFTSGVTERNEGRAISGCLSNIPEWVRDPHSDTLGREFMIGSGGLTDKSTSHKYQIMYHRYMSPFLMRSVKPKFRMLEIGLGCGPTGGMANQAKPGGSTLAWKHLFLSSSVELDLHVMEYDAECASKWEKENPGIATKVHSGDASSTHDMDQVYHSSGGLPFDMIIDDASHLNEHQIFTFLHMIKYVSKGGFYVIEDIHSSCRSWNANTGTTYTGAKVQGTDGCMETQTGYSTIFSKLVEWQKSLVIQKSPFPDVTSIEIGFQAAVISKEY